MSDDGFPPRGSGVFGRTENSPSESWGHPSDLGPSWDWKPGMVLLGYDGQRILGRDDDRHVVTIAGARGGKSSTVLIPNLLRYPGSVVVLDPKGELTKACAEMRRRMGQKVFVLDPFGATGMASAQHNPFDDIRCGNPNLIAADTAQAADALIVNNARDPHWTDSGKNLVRGIALHLLSTGSEIATISVLRRHLNSTPAEFDRLFEDMVNSDAFDGIVHNIGRSFLGKKESGGRELQSILSTVQEQTASFDDLANVTERSDFRISDLRKGNMSVFLVLPGMRMGTHYRWLRLFIQLAIAAMEATPPERGALPVWFVLEEFAALGHLRTIETAAGFMAGFGVKLWSVLQDLSQLKTHYPKSWETFLGNAGIIQAFANQDITTTEHLSKMLGSTQVIERHDGRVSASSMAHGDTGRRENLRSVRLLDPNEITRHFARETFRQLILMPGRPPIYMQRLPHNA